MYRKILVPMALDHGVSGDLLAIARNMLSEGGEITALHVRQAPMGTANVEQSRALEEHARAYAAALLTEKTKDQDVKAEMVEGHVYRTIIDYAAEHNIDCIVMGSHRPGLSDFLLGSTAARVVRHAPCSVHVHRS